MSRRPARSACRALAPLLLAAVLPVPAACSDARDSASCTVPAGVEVDWMHRIGCPADYELLWNETNDVVFAHTRTVLWLIDREDDSKLYFINTVKYALHYGFAARYLDYGPPFTPVGTHGDFNILNYRRPGRRFLMGLLVHYQDQGLVTLELSAGDTADADMITDAYQRVRGALFDGDQLVYRPVSAEQEAMIPELSARIPTVSTQAVFAGQSYQPLNPVVGFGTLRFRRLAQLEGEPLAPTDIAVVDRVPNDISLVSGLVTQEFQTPLAHVGLLAKNRGTPNMALRGAFDDPRLRAFEDQLVRLEVGPHDWSVRAATPAEAQAYWDTLRPAAPLIPHFDLSVTRPVDLADAGTGDAIRIGSKAANLAEVEKIRVDGAPIVMPDRPMAIPFYFYDQHMQESGLYPVVNQILADAPGLTSEELEQRLFDLRWRIYRAPIDPDSLALIAGEVRSRWGDDTRVKFRSSTNVEDLPSFSGAGLYTSAGATPSDGDAALANAIKVVWASTWNLQAFVERDFYRIDQTQVRMGVLMHPAMTNELANGVAVTINEFADNRPAYYINGQLGEVSVTNPTGLAIPEQLLYYTWFESPEYEVITRSSLVEDRPDWPDYPSLLSETELEKLASYLAAIHDHFKALAAPDPDFAMDVEWKLAPGRVMYVKQARPLVRKEPDP